MTTGPFFSKLCDELLPKVQGSKRPVVLALQGPLGIGKTTFAKEFLERLGYDARKVQSPSFLKLFEYEIPKVGLCVHLDCYRMESVLEFSHLALENYSAARLWIVEWPDLFFDFLREQAALKGLVGLNEGWRLDFKGTPGIVEVGMTEWGS